MLKVTVLLAFIYIASGELFRHDDKDSCYLLPEAGPCMADMTRWYFNKKSGTCEEFSYGGCSGNDNNFMTKSECLSKCGRGRVEDHDAKVSQICVQEKDIGPCEAAVTRWFFNSQTKRCEVFLYGGCDGNDNNFMSEDDCKETCYTHAHT